MVTTLLLPLNQPRYRLADGPMDPGYRLEYFSRLELPYMINTPLMLALFSQIPLLLGLRCFIRELPIRLSCTGHRLGGMQLKELGCGHHPVGTGVRDLHG